ncbi:uncharacterized protein [Littorina saxatilis]|uniref:Uncharacterized protein n=1 Tax=Littorina saxatilis TaxID=31220 RepID=A0AAN9BBP1_9CAEN
MGQKTPQANSSPSPWLAFFLLLFILTAVSPTTDACDFENVNDDTRLTVRNYMSQDNVRLVEYEIHVQGYSREFWRNVGGQYWFQPWRWFRAKGTNSERLLLLFHYYYGLLKPYLGIGTRTVDLELRLNVSGCLNGLSSLELEQRMRQFLYYDLGNATERSNTKFDDADIRVCTMHVGSKDGWGRLVYYCCSRNDAGNEFCSEISDDHWVWVLRSFIVILSVLLFLYFPMMIPKGYHVYSFYYHPPDNKSFNMMITTTPEKYQDSSKATVLSSAHWRKMLKFRAEISKLQPDVIYRVKVKRMTFECEMDRLLSETSSPVSAFRSIFDSLVRCKVRHADPLEDCCNTPVCGELCCHFCPAWHVLLRVLRTILVLLVLALPAVPILYAMAAEDLEYQELAGIYRERDLHQSYNFYPGSVFGKVIVAMLSSLYLLHLILVVIDGCHDHNLARAYTQLLQVTRRKTRLRDRVSHSQSIIRKIFWPIKRFGILAIPAGIILLVLLPVILIVYFVVTSPVPKLLVHVGSLVCGKTKNRRRKTKAEMTALGLLESVLFVVTLIDVFAVLTLSVNFVVHVVVILLVQAVVDLSFVTKFLPIIILLAVYARDSFKVVNNTYASHHNVVLRHVLNTENEDIIKREADKDWHDQENKILKIVPFTALDPKRREDKEEESYKSKKLFFFKNGAVRMRTRSLIMFLDKEDILSIPKKFLFHTTTIRCPGSPGRLDEAYLKAACRFGRTVVFLLFVLLVVLAYADMYYLSPTITFFATLLTGAIPLILRYFFFNPGTVSKVDTSTLRFQTQMDDKVESFEQSWVVEDMQVDTIILPKDFDELYHPTLKPFPETTEEEEPEKKEVEKEVTWTYTPTPPRPRTSSPRLSPGELDGRKRLKPPPNQPHQGYANYMMEMDTEKDAVPDGLQQYQQFNNATMEPQADDLQQQWQHTARPPPSPRPVAKGEEQSRTRKKSKQTPMPLDDNPEELIDGRKRLQPSQINQPGQGYANNMMPMDTENDAVPDDIQQYQQFNNATMEPQADDLQQEHTARPPPSPRPAAKGEEQPRTRKKSKQTPMPLDDNPEELDESDDLQQQRQHTARPPPSSRLAAKGEEQPRTRKKSKQTPTPLDDNPEELNESDDLQQQRQHTARPPPSSRLAAKGEEQPRTRKKSKQTPMPLDDNPEELNESDDLQQQRQYTARPPPSSRLAAKGEEQPRTRKKSKQTPMPLDDNPDLKKSISPPPPPFLPNGVITKPSGKWKGKGKKSKKSKTKKPLRIDLVIDISQEDLTFYNVHAEETKMGASSRPPSIHWNRRSRLAPDNRKDDYDV